MESISKEGEEVVRDMNELVGQSQSSKVVYQTSDRNTIQKSKLDQFPALAPILAGEQDANEALYEAVKNGRIEHLIMILACRAKLESKDGFITIWWTPLHSAAASGDAVLVQRLLQEGAEANLQVASFTGPLHLACRNEVIHLYAYYAKNVPTDSAAKTLSPNAPFISDQPC